jgi:hypothetical protein
LFSCFPAESALEELATKRASRILDALAKRKVILVSGDRERVAAPFGALRGF